MGIFWMSEGETGDPGIKFTENEITFLQQNEACRIATSYNDKPHVTPISYLFEHEAAGDKNRSAFYFATDYGSKKYKNLQRNRNVALAIDIYNSSVDNKAVIVQGIVVEFISKGEEFRRLYNLFYQKFEWVRKDPWTEGEAPFVKVKPLGKASWGLDDIGDNY